MPKKDFKIENNIYSKEIISESIKDFDGFDIKYSNNVLSISGATTENINEIFNEFMNYVLGIQNETI